MKTLIDLDEDLLALAAKELGTMTKKDTVNAALAFVVDRGERVDVAIDDHLMMFGVGPDIDNEEIMRGARR